MSRSSWFWVVLAFAPACALVQPLDSATPDSPSGGSSTSHAGSTSSGASGGANSTGGSSAHGGSTSSGGSDTTTGGSDTTTGGSDTTTGGSGAAGRGSGGGGMASGASGNRGGSGGTSAEIITPSSFVGTWQPTSGTFTETCNGTSTNQNVPDTVTWSLGTSSDLVQVDATSTCTLDANVVGNRAVGVPDQICTGISTDTGTGDQLFVEFAFSSYTFALSSDGQTATESISGDINYTDTTTFDQLDCPFTQTATYSVQ